MKEEKFYCVYIMTNQRNTVFYTGVTSNVIKRVNEHKEKIHKGFTNKYNVNKLLYCESFDNVNKAIFREKQIKAGSRRKKIELIEKNNPNYRDLSDDWDIWTIK